MKQILLALTVISVLGLGFARQAIAQDALNLGPIASSHSSQDSSLFDQLHDLFETGTQPEIADLAGWRSGRCYHADSRSVPYNSLLAGWTVSGPDHGPIAPPDLSLSTLPVHWQNGAPGAFDELTPDIEASVGQFIESQKPGVACSVFDRGSVYGSYRQSPGTPWIMRKNQDYIVTEMIQNGFVVQMCYYFKLVRQ